SISHRVEKQETLYSLSKRFNVSGDEIKAANGGLPQGLREGMVLRIPKTNEVSKPQAPAKTTDSNPFQTSTTVSGTANNTGSKFQDNRNQPMFGDYKVAIMLPFEMARMDSLDHLGHDLVALEFYQGAMIAIDSLRQLGLDMDVYVFDTNKDASRVKQLTSKPELSNVDLFIGPMYKTELLALSDFAATRQSHVVCPVPQAGGILLNRPFLSKAHCDDATQLSGLARFILRRYSQENLVMIAPVKPTREKFNSLFSSAFAAARNGGPLLKELTTDLPTTTSIEAKLVSGKTNVIYVATNELSYISSLITKLIDLQSRYDIVLVGNEDWVKLDQIDNSYKNRLHLHLPMANFVDYDSDLVKNFLYHYRDRYGSDPNK
ncbi:MAG: LysM domain-containing protein, partial [Bacteroidota bacterium]